MGVAQAALGQDFGALGKGEGQLFRGIGQRLRNGNVVDALALEAAASLLRGALAASRGARGAAEELWRMSIVAVVLVCKGGAV